MCSYPGHFPPRLPHYFIQKFTRPGDVVFDPFSGRGTTALQACIEGRLGIGSDLNPLACCLTAAKVTPPDPVDLRNRIDDLSNDMFFAPVGQEPEYIRRLFHERTLSQLVFLKQELDAQDRTDAFILAVLLGLVQNGDGGGGKPGKGSEGLSIALPRSVCQSPDHILAYLDEHGLTAPERDVFPLLRSRIEQLTRQGLPRCRGRVWDARIQDVRTLADPALKNRQVQLIVSAPRPSRTQTLGRQTTGCASGFRDEDAEQLDLLLDRLSQTRSLPGFLGRDCRRSMPFCAQAGICAWYSRCPEKGTRPRAIGGSRWARLEARHTRFQLARSLRSRPGAALVFPSEEKPEGERAVLKDAFWFYTR
jgi:site-specific DNA-methyltransferase (adenine-specific)